MGTPPHEPRPASADPTADGTAHPTVDEALLDALVRTSYTVIGVVSAVAARHDLSLTLLRVVAILRDRSLTMSELAGYLGLDRSTVTGMVDRATRRGLVLRVGDASDGRSRRVTLTDAGQVLATACAEQISLALAPVVDRVEPAEHRRLTTLLTTLAGIA